MVKACISDIRVAEWSLPASRGHTRFQTTQFTRFENDRAIVLLRHQEQ